MANAVYLNDTSLDVHRIKEMGGKEATVGQGRQVLCDLGKLRKSLWREIPPCKGALAKASPGVWSQKGKTVIDLIEIDLSLLLHRGKKPFLKPKKCVCWYLK